MTASVNQPMWSVAVTAKTETVSSVLTDHMAAVFSADRVYRYRLERRWPTGTLAVAARQVHVIGLNPSTADESTDDPTIRRLIGFARDWGYGSLVVTNLFAYRSTDPTRLTMAERTVGAVGPQNDQHILQAARSSGMTVAAWGHWGRLFGRDRAVLSLLARHSAPICMFGLTKHGYPKHPLYLPRTTQPVPWPSVLWP